MNAMSYREGAPRPAAIIDESSVAGSSEVISALPINAMSYHQQFRFSTAMCGEQFVGNGDIRRVECFDQHEQAQLLRCLDERIELRASQHAHDHEDAAGPCKARLGHLVGFDQKILAHRRNAARRLQRPRRLLQMIQRTFEDLGLCKDGNRSSAGSGVAGDSCKDVLVTAAQHTHRRGTQLDLGDHIELLRRQHQFRRLR
jgi:hypothetical protein